MRLEVALVEGEQPQVLARGFDRPLPRRPRSASSPDDLHVARREVLVARDLADLEAEGVEELAQAALAPGVVVRRPGRLVRAEDVTNGDPAATDRRLGIEDERG